MLVTNPTISNPRADGFSLYMNFVGDNILKNMMPKSKMIRSTIHKITPKSHMGVPAITENGGQEVMATFSKNKYQ